jgi:hypothetical protein
MEDINSKIVQIRKNIAQLSININQMKIKLVMIENYIDGLILKPNG